MKYAKSYEEVAEAIRNMTVRGAPAIGVAAAMGVAMGMQKSTARPARICASILIASQS